MNDYNALNVSKSLSYNISLLSCNKLNLNKKLRDRDRINALDWCFDNNKIVTASNAGNIIIWNSSKNEKLIGIPLKSGWTQTVVFSPDANKIACGGLDNLC